MRNGRMQSTLWIFFFFVLWQRTSPCFRLRLLFLLFGLFYHLMLFIFLLNLLRFEIDSSRPVYTVYPSSKILPPPFKTAFAASRIASACERLASLGHVGGLLHRQTNSTECSHQDRVLVGRAPQEPPDFGCIRFVLMNHSIYTRTIQQGLYND